MKKTDLLQRFKEFLPLVAECLHRWEYKACVLWLQLFEFFLVEMELISCDLLQFIAMYYKNRVPFLQRNETLFVYLV